jgi:raffinose/stachyose/melibiose transport system substrate-binding protein
MSKVWIKGSMVLLLVSLVLLGCSSRTSTPNAASETPKSTETKVETKTDAPPAGPKTKLSVFSTVSDQSIQDLYKGLVADFKKENPNTEVDLQFPGSNYENILKVKMAANDMPDVFDTHGWAKVRYGKFLADLKDEAWASQQTDTIKNVVTDKDGKVYALVLSEAKDGLTYNVDMLKKYNIEIPKTYEELTAAAEKILKESGGKTVPFYFSGVDDGMIGQFFDYFATSQLISSKQNEADALLNNTFDWTKWTPLAQKFIDWKKKGLINKDALTAKYSDLPKAFANEQVTFSLNGPSFADEVHKIKPDLKIGFMPVPSMVAGDEPNFSGGERFTMGAWKDSKALPEAKKLIAFFAKADNMTKIANATKLPSGLKGITAKHEFTEYYDKYASVRVFPYFDRVYLPNGMWDVMTKQGTELLAERITPAQFSDKMKQEVNRLLKK